MLRPDDAARICDAAAATHLLHAAWALPSGYWNAGGNLDWASKALALLREAHRHGVKRAVGIGTCAEYGTMHDLCDESTSIMQPEGAYARAKLATSWLFHAAGDSLGISTAWARLFFPYGPGDKAGKLIPHAIARLSAGEPAEFTSGEQVRDLLCAPDVGAAVAALLMGGVTGPVNVASGRGIAVRDVILRVGELMGRPDLIRLGALQVHGLEAPRWVAAVSRLTQEVGWHPTISLDQGLRSMIPASCQAGGPPPESVARSNS
jgi:nucleoside-diphosphate-sugar epimerase